MPEAIPYAALALLALGAWVGGIALLDVFTAVDVRGWRRMAHLRGFATRGSVFERAVRHAPMLKRIQAELDLERLLGQANSSDTPGAFLARTGAIALMTFAIVIAATTGGRALEGGWPAPPWAALVIAGLILPLSLIDLRRRSREARAASARTLGDMLMAIAVMTDSGGLQLDDAVRVMSRCARDAALQNLLDRGGFKRLTKRPHRSTAEKYRLIGDAYQIREFAELADAAASTNVGVPDRVAYTRLALTVYQERLADARVHAARARILITLPIAGMLIPLLLLIGAPTFNAISVGLGG
ncbi:MAG TPA: hypothetical protein VND54_00770 [Candidatus Saccharimonadales bacterium]|nr:hypothetical protein [Candidatus Saccharimonadales bacterium]